jgi:DNA invertase Pin-like site-specific DNA recombinase
MARTFYISGKLIFHVFAMMAEFERNLIYGEHMLV